MNKDTTELKIAPIWKLILKYSIPAIIGMMVNALYTVVDRIFIGNMPEIGGMAMASLGVTMPMVQIINAFGILLAVGGATAISLKLGKDEKEEAEKILGNVFSLTIVLGIILATISIVFSEEILISFGGSEDSLPMAIAYMNVISMGIPFALFGSVFGFLIRGDGNPKFSANVMVVGCIVNIVLDAVFIFLFDLGIQGAALATIMSQLLTTVLGFYYYMTKKSSLAFRTANFKLNFLYVKQIILIGLAPFATQIAGSITQIIMNNMLQTYGGDLAIGALSTMFSVLMIFGMPIMGLTTGIQPIISYNYGAEEYKRVVETIKLAGIAATSFLMVVWVFLLNYPETIILIFNDDPTLLEMTADAIKKYFIMLPLMGITYVGSNFIQSTGDAKVALVLSLMRQCIFLIPLLFVFPRIWGLDGVWYTQPASDVLSGVVSSYIMYKTIKGYDTATATENKRDCE